MQSVDFNRQSAYRYLLYQAMLEIRLLQFEAEPWRLLWYSIWRPEWGWRRVRYAGELAEWMHNLAAFVAEGFKGFDEGYFWAQGYRLAQQYPYIHAYKCKFECRLFEFEHGRWPQAGEGPNHADHKIPPPPADAVGPFGIPYGRLMGRRL